MSECGSGGACPASGPHFVYACNALAFTVPILSDLCRQLISALGADAMVLVDGGSDSLMVGEEEGLGDPVEDAVSVTAVAAQRHRVPDLR